MFSSKSLLVFFILLIFKNGVCDYISVPCRLDFDCEECLPDYMPMVVSHPFNTSIVHIDNGNEVLFSCEKGKFFLYPEKSVIRGFCENDRYRIQDDTAIRHILELGCQENVFEDVQHQVDGCKLTLQGRAYITHLSTGLVRHLAQVCFDQDAAIPLFIHMMTCTENDMPLKRHSDDEKPLSLLGNFNHMFDAKTRSEAEKLYTDYTRMNKRMYEKLKHDNFVFAGQNLVPAKLLSGEYFQNQNTRATNFISNKISLWKSVADGNMHHIRTDVASLIKSTNVNLDIYVGIHDVFTAKSGSLENEVYLKPGKRFPVPKYIWTVIQNSKEQTGVAIILLNDPFISVSEIRKNIFCESKCSKLTWLRELMKDRHFETAVYGLVFCCDVHEFRRKVTELPESVLSNLKFGDEGLLTTIPVAYNN